MRHCFLLDENVLVDGFLDTSAWTVWFEIAKNCHNLGVSPLLYARYKQKLNLPEVQAPASDGGPGFPRLITSILANSAKSIYATPGESSELAALVRDDDDRFLADIAFELVSTCEMAECIFVSTDQQTVNDFNQPKMLQLGIRGVTVQEAVTLASEAAD